MKILFLILLLSVNSCPNDDQRCVFCQNNQCKMCYDSFLDLAGVCQVVSDQVDYCLIYLSNGICKICQYGYYSNEFGKCVKIELDQCLEFESEDKCRICYNKVLPVEGKCGTKKCTQKNCALCYEQNGIEKCELCVADFAIEINQQKRTNSCVQKTDIPHCQYLNTTNDKCAICEINYYWSDGDCLLSEEYSLFMSVQITYTLLYFFFLINQKFLYLLYLIMKNNRIISLLVLLSYAYLYTSKEEPISKELQHSDKIQFGSAEFYMYIFYAIVIVLFAGLMSGLTVGYNSIDLLHLELVLNGGTDEQIDQAQKILPIIEQKHLLLATLLLSNSLAMESLPIFLDAIMPATMAIILSTTVVLIFGEVLPQAICLGENQIKIAAKMAPVINFLMKILWPVCYPISKGLDYFLGQGENKVRFAKKDLKTLIQLHQQGHNEQNTEAFSHEEVTIINSIIDIRNVSVRSIMVPLERSFKLKDEQVIDKELIGRIKDKNFSRIPIFTQEYKCRGFLKTKTLLKINENIGKKISSFKAHTDPIFVAQNMNLLEALTHMKEKQVGVLIITKDRVQNRQNLRLKSKNEMIIKSDQDSSILGFVFLKDIFEEMIKSQIHDNDLHYDSVNQIYGRPKTQVKPVQLKEPEENTEFIEEDHESLLKK